jgi:hypothetical protein
MTLYRDPTVKFGGEALGGIRVSHLSHIGAPVEGVVTVSKGKRKPFRIDPLADVITSQQAQQLAALMKTAGIVTRDDALQYVNDVLSDRPSPAMTSDELTTDEAGRVIDALTTDTKGES